MEHKIIGVHPNSPAKEAGIEPGDMLCCIDKLDVVDIFDYLDYTSRPVFELGIRDVRTDKVRYINIQKDEADELGLVFEEYLMSPQRRCKNKCVFCFEDQLPSCARKSLLAKDDDWRMSVIAGNYVTLTNVTDGELARIAERKASPLYISVHALGKARVDMMGNPDADKIWNQLSFLAKNGISFHAQIVHCPGYNDGEVLLQTVKSLFELYPMAQTVAVVPVGLTAHRDGLKSLEPHTRESALFTIRQIHELQKQCLERVGTRFVFASDELYCLAGEELPSFEAYEDFAQIENGVGLMRKFEGELDDALTDCPKGTGKGKSFALITGTAAKNWLERIARKVTAHTGAEAEVYAIENEFFGYKVDVAGLVTGGDISSQFSPKQGQSVVIPSCMLKADEDIFLDDMTLEQLEEKLGVPVTVADVDGEAFLNILAGTAG